jgi:hypothetical protein
MISLQVFEPPDLTAVAFAFEGADGQGCASVRDPRPTPRRNRLQAPAMHGFFWLVFPVTGCGIGLVNAWDVFWRHPITGAEIQREIEHEDKQG